MVIGIVNTINKIVLIAIIRQIMMMVAPCGNAKLCFRIGLFQAELGQLDLHMFMMMLIIIIFIIFRIRLFIIIIITIIIIMMMTDGSIS